jgi:hypothetical protein
VLGVGAIDPGHADTVVLRIEAMPAGKDIDLVLLTRLPQITAHRPADGKLVPDIAALATKRQREGRPHES